MTIFLVVGLCGSGKTFWAYQNADIVIDDIVSIDSLPTQEEVCGNTVAITSPLFCCKTTLDKAKEVLLNLYPKEEIECVYFENAPEKCLKNVDYRGDKISKNVDGFITFYSKIYEPPETALKIWTP